MTPAGFDTRRRSLGLTIAETAAQCKAPEVAVQRWQDGTSPIPAGAIEALEHLELTMAHTARRMAERASTLGRIAPLVLFRYRTEDDIGQSGWELPLGAHAMLIAWASQEMEANGIVTRIEWAELAT